jgi:phage terminase small subunit
MLNERQRAFALEYVKTGDATNSAKSSGYSVKTAAQIGCTLLKHTEVAAEIARLTTRIEKKSALSADKILDALSNLVDFDPAQLFGDDGKLLPINKMPLEARKAIAGIDGEKLRFSSRLGAIELSAKILQLVKQEQTQQTAVQIVISAPPELPKVAPNVGQLLPEWD